MKFMNLLRNSGINVYDELTQREKLAALNLMVVFGGSGSGNIIELKRINSIISEEAKIMRVPPYEMHIQQFSGMVDMIESIKNINKNALERLFWAYYRIFAACKSKEGILVLWKIYNELGFSESDCVKILEEKTGRKLSDL